MTEIHFLLFLQCTLKLTPLFDVLHITVNPLRGAGGGCGGVGWEGVCVWGGMPVLWIGTLFREFLCKTVAGVKVMD